MSYSFFYQQWCKNREYEHDIKVPEFPPGKCYILFKMRICVTMTMPKWSAALVQVQCKAPDVLRKSIHDAIAHILSSNQKYCLLILHFKTISLLFDRPRSNFSAQTFHWTSSNFQCVSKAFSTYAQHLMVFVCSAQVCFASCLCDNSVKVVQIRKQKI